MPALITLGSALRLGAVLLTQGPVPADTMVDVGGHRLHFRIIRGQGATIVLESGGGMNATQWDSLAPSLAKSTGATVVAYDRAGFGKSDASDAAYDIHREVSELWRALDHLRLDHSLVLVGHSYGGFLIETLAALHPSAVRGLVFVDPNTAGFIDATGGPGFPTARGDMDRFPFDTTDLGRLTPVQRASLRQSRGFPATIAALRAISIPAGIPIRVITAGKGWWPTPELNRAWRKAHEALAGSVRDGRLLVADRSAHMIPAAQPEIIAAAVRELLEP